MYQLRNFAALDRPDRALVACATFLLVVRAGPWIFRFQTAYGLLDSIALRIPVRRGLNATEVSRIVATVTLAGRHIPATTCLTEALVLRLLLALRGYSAMIRIGMARSDRGQVEDRAWVEMDGKILWPRDEDVSRYAPIPILEGLGRKAR